MAASSSHAPIPAAAVGQIKAGLSIVSIHIIIRSISSRFAMYIRLEDMELRGIINALVQSAGFSLKTQPRLVTSYYPFMV